MQLLTLLAFAMLFWRGEQPGEWVLVPAGDVFWTMTAVLAPPVILGFSACAAMRIARRMLIERPQTPEAAQRFHHRAVLLLRVGTAVSFGVLVFLTHWPDWFLLGSITPALQIVGDAIVLTPYLANLLVVWVATYPIERYVHQAGHAEASAETTPTEEAGGLVDYLDFQIRHCFLVIACPMLLILFTSNMTRGHGPWLCEVTGWEWTPEVLLGVVAVGVFVLAPAMLRHIWRTTPLEPGPLRDRLEEACRRVGLRCRDILRWDSRGMMINAAVMGVVASLRFVLLSDALLANMSSKQIEAAFGHEAGHIRHRHIQHFLVFAALGWAAVAGVMELAAHALADPEATGGSPLAAVEVVGVVATVLVWGVGFGWLSRRFERQADVFGARCVTPKPADCKVPCSVHPDAQTSLTTRGRVCASGAEIFVSALDRVALLNGIPHEEPSWRHSSIGNRMRFLTSLAGDPNRAARFETSIRRTKRALIALALASAALTAYYWITVPEPAIFQL
ncbi:MAG: M48 family metallopeptidase [Phycisphaerae bacterium]